ncbi:aerobic-type carbon monoxide dehydrogenase small subunit (CoxS/CutS family) [Paraburkholderia bannensis]|uniref:Aerobic-type carbon monoxide dehydrogenase small subunit (CoxS/CutS family) n=1 Tax=Paraburkholderia bannensis TaxID=765414 RepID=A0A7W9U0H9_9BURK|nr:MULTISPECIES: (2Fe-2S)-binding protein [Paraburkholderia]MBB3258602.1 aerobic-type carbon monoxide dehydrogenase small subunit (CoxS/CutS family) [Paraburkholderia sp. WP4_3_2]MBB6103615.1 aerobic-type carbon monoxide dehydrogenase small subunit (CoxS/CutS family) [Paraburkholderia bannensis]
MTLPPSAASAVSASAAATASAASAPQAPQASQSKAQSPAPVEHPLVQYKPKALSLTINGKSVGPMQVPEGLMMIEFLHEYAGLTGSRLGCGQGVCHACVVILDKADGTSEEMRTCITGAHFFNGSTIRTVEGHAKRNEAGEVVELSPIQQKFLEHFSFQCGYCTPGFVNAATVLIERLKREPVAKADVESTIMTALDGHLCRCTGYVRYYEAVKDVVMTTPGLVKDAA